ncbi:MAG: protein translocase subunit SecDF, partial [Porphyromonadaceae bacterium]|nr:protein translocase subunit SecDF [Porphyromonadaceae bacterium]
MQNKGFIRVIAILLALVCLFYISFSFVTRYYNQKAEKISNGDPVAYRNYLDSMATEKVYLGYYTLKQCNEMEIGLGLDLKGGMNVTLQISVADVLRSLSNNNPDAKFNAALASATANQADNSDFLTVFLNEYRKLDPNIRLASIFSTYQLKEKISPNATNDQVLSVLREELNSAIDNSFNVLRTRIDRFGVVSPNIQRLEKTGRILVELPGVKEPERVRKLLQGSANLEFWETYNMNEIYSRLVAVNEMIARMENNGKPVVAEEKSSDEEDELSDLVQGNQEEELWTRQTPRFSRLQPSLSQNGQPLANPSVGYAHYRDTAAVNAYLALPQVREMLPTNLCFSWTVKSIDEKEQYYQLVALKSSTGGRPALEGDVINDAREDFDRLTNSPVVSMTMNAEGTKIWAQLTRENVGRCVAVVLDDHVYSFPVVNSEIPNGSSQISGGFTPEEAKDLANVLKTGKMAASVKIVQEDVVGPSLGQEAIHSGIISFIFALILLMIYMICIYGIVPGLTASVALIFNLFFTLGILASFQAVLTLSGIAGLVLSLGIAVDANVLIYERSKEELRAGKGLKNAISDGYKNAFSAIFDSNLTSVITGLILFYFGTGPIRGFATTLLIGIVCSFFTAVFLTRLFYERGLEKNWFKHLSFTTKISKNLLVNPGVNFLGIRKRGYIVCLLLVIVGCVSFAVRGLNKGIDFSGGRNYIVRFEKPVSTQYIADLLKPQFGENIPTVITIGGDNQVRISTNYRINESDESIDEEILTMIYNGLKDEIGGKPQEAFESENVMSIQKVGPSIAKDI